MSAISIRGAIIDIGDGATIIIERTGNTVSMVIDMGEDAEHMEVGLTLSMTDDVIIALREARKAP